MAVESARPTQDHRHPFRPPVAPRSRLRPLTRLLATVWSARLKGLPRATLEFSAPTSRPRAGHIDGVAIARLHLMRSPNMATVLGLTLGHRRGMARWHVKASVRRMVRAHYARPRARVEGFFRWMPIQDRAHLYRVRDDHRYPQEGRAAYPQTEESTMSGSGLAMGPGRDPSEGGDPRGQAASTRTIPAGQTLRGWWLHRGGWIATGTVTAVSAVDIWFWWTQGTPWIAQLAGPLVLLDLFLWGMLAGALALLPANVLIVRMIKQRDRERGECSFCEATASSSSSGL